MLAGGSFFSKVLSLSTLMTVAPLVALTWLAFDFAWMLVVRSRISGGCRTTSPKTKFWGNCLMTFLCNYEEIA